MHEIHGIKMMYYDCISLQELRKVTVPPALKTDFPHKYLKENQGTAEVQSRDKHTYDNTPKSNNK
jgi:hypothetical protein